MRPAGSEESPPPGEARRRELQRPLAGVLLGAVACLIWSTTYLGGRFVLREPGVTPLLAALVRYGIGGALLLAYLAIKEPSGLRAIARGSLRLAALGLVGVSLQGTLVFWSLRLAPAMVASVLCNLAPLFVALLGAALKVEPPDAASWAGILVGFWGAVIVSASGAGGEAPGSEVLLGSTVAVAGSAAWAVYTFFSRPASVELGAMPVAAWSVAIGAAGIGAACLVAKPTGSPSPVGWLVLVYLGVFPTALAYVLWQVALERAPAHLVAPTLYLTPLGTIALAGLTLGERMTAAFALGAALVFLGLYLASFRKRLP